MTEFSPAKLNLFLAVTGRRPDGYHDLVSVVAPLAWGDDLSAQPSGEGADRLSCDDPALPVGATNLILKAAAAFRTAGGKAPGLAFRLAKRIPVGAGLGGGSSNAVAALRLLQRHASTPLEPNTMAQVAAGIGADCALFLAPGPVVMRGRGEQLSPLPAEAEQRIRGRRVVIFKPGFGIATAWAYARLAAQPGGLLPPAEAEARLQAWLAAPGAPAEALLFNQMEQPAFLKYPALPVLQDQLTKRFQIAPRMSGSGSACFALLPAAGGPPVTELAAAIRICWGPSAFVMETRLA